MAALTPGLRRAAADPELRGWPMQVYVQCLFDLDFSCWRPVKQEYYARILKMHREQVGRALRKLVHLGYLDAGPIDGRLRTYRIPLVQTRSDPETSHIRHA